MASMPGYHISKGPFDFLDGRFNGANPQNYIDALNRLAGPLLAAAQARFPGDPKVSHFQDDWLTSGNWAPLKPEQTLQAGLSAAIKAAIGVAPTAPIPVAAPATARPMEFFWICAREQEFHVYYFDGPRQVTVFIFTPPPIQPGGGPNAVTPASLGTPEHLFVVKKRDWESTPPGQTYPGPITTMVAAPGPGQPEIILREVYR